MSVYLRHYWSLYAEFIDSFGSITYKNIPLALLANFYQYLNGDIQEQMKQPQFQDVLKQNITDQSQIQPLFERYLTPIRKQPVLPIKGKILVNGTYHRFQPSVFLEHFHPENTLLLSRGKPYLGIPIVTLSHFDIDVTEVVNEITEQITQLLTLHVSHPVFSEPHFQKRLLDDAARMIKTLASMENMLKATPVSCAVVGTAEDMTCRILVLMAASLGIPSVCLQHGVIMGEEAFMPVFTTIQAVYGQYETDWYTRRGVSPDAIRIIGHPKFDMIYTKEHEPTPQVAEKLAVQGHTAKILIITQPMTNKPLIEAAVKQLLQIQDLEILIKPHPYERKKGLLAEYQQLVNEHSLVQIVPVELDLYELLPNIDIVITENSTVGLEAMLLDRLVIIFRNPLEEKDYPYYDGMAPFIASDPQALRDLVEKAWKDPVVQGQLRSTIEEFLRCSYPLQLAARQLVLLISELTGKPVYDQNVIVQEGLLINEPALGVCQIENGHLRPFASTAAFQAAGHKWADVYHIDERLLAQLPIEGPHIEGMLIKGSGPDIYRIESGMKRLLTSRREQGNDPSEQTVYVVDDRILTRIPSGLCI